MSDLATITPLVES